MLEQQIQSRILKKLKERGIWAIKVINANRRGCPDILACYGGDFVAIEVKRPDGVLSKIQEAQLKRIAESGGIAIVATCWEEVAEIIDKNLFSSL